MATEPATITVGLHAVNNVTTRLAKADPGATVSQFATVAQSAFGISPEELVVYFNGHEIDQSAALAAAGVCTCLCCVERADCVPWSGAKRSCAALVTLTRGRVACVGARSVGRYLAPSRRHPRRRSGGYHPRHARDVP